MSWIDSEPDSSPIIVKPAADGFVTILINRPGVRNALRQADKANLAEAIKEAGRLPDVRAIVISGTDARAFCAGTDVSEMESLSLDRAAAMFQVEEELYRSVLESPAVVIAAVEGAAMGAGCVLTACTDVVIAGDGAVFAMPEVRLGLPAPMQTAILQQVIGLGRARRMLLTCEPLTSSAAREAGLVSEVVDCGTAIDRARAVASQVGQFPSAGIRLQKLLINSWISGEYSTAVSLSPFVAAVGLMDAGGKLDLRRTMVGGNPG